MPTTKTKLRSYRYDDLSRLMSLMTGDEKHSFAATSTLDVIWTLYDKILTADSRHPGDPHRDRFVLSKGHGPMAYYAVMAAKGYLTEDDLTAFAAYDSILGHHPDATLIPGVEYGAGSLGHGLPVGVGIALGLKIQSNPARTFVLLGDGELDEGSNHEAIAIAGRRQLASLTAIVVDNQSASQGWPGGIESRFAGEGWATQRVNGRDHKALENALCDKTPTKPKAIVALVERRSG